MSAVSSSAGSGRIHNAGLRIGILNAYLALEAIGIAPEEAEEWSEIGNEVVGGSSSHQSFANGFERFKGVGLQCEVVDASATKHGGLALVFGVSFDLKHIDLGPLAEFEDRKTRSFAFGKLGTVTHEFGVEHVGVERDQSIKISGDERDVIDSFSEHGDS